MTTSQRTCSQNATEPKLSHLTPALRGGACPSQHAPPASTEVGAVNPNPYPHGRWTVLGNSTPATSLLAAPLRTLFWSQPDTERLIEAEQRITAFLSAALAPGQIQLFDDLYELPAC